MPTEQFLEVWRADLVSELVIALTALRSSIGEIELAAFAIDCHPWHGSIYLAALTSEEARTEPTLDCLEEMAQWGLYDFASEPRGHSPEMIRLGRVMQEQWTSSGESTELLAEAAEAFLVACARAAGHPSVSRAVAAFSRAESFRINVAHPDSNREFYPSA